MDDEGGHSSGHYDMDGEEHKAEEAEETHLPRGVVKHVKLKDGTEDERIVIRLRACLSCRLVLSEQQFYEEGCPNCAFLQMDGDRHRVWDCTTVNFSGFLSLMNPNSSWVAKFNRLTEVVPGCYAVNVVGELPESVKDDMHRASRYAGDEDGPLD